MKKLSLFRLPGDVMIDRPGFKFFFPHHDNAADQRSDLYRGVDSAEMTVG